MRLKSYFAPSVQNAIAMARREFGDEITLVTSHVAPAEARHLGEYEVVFDVEEEARPVKRALVVAAAPLAAVATIAEQKPETAAPVITAVTAASTATATPAVNPVLAFTAFQETLLSVVAPKPALEEEKALKLRQLRLTLIELGVEAGLTRAIMGMLEGSMGKRKSRSAANPALETVFTEAGMMRSAATPALFEVPMIPAQMMAAQTTLEAQPMLAAPALPVMAPVETPLSAPVMKAFEAGPVEISEQEQAATQSGKIVLISKRRELHAAATTAAISSTNAYTASPSGAKASVGLTAAEREFLSSLSEPVAAPLERLAVGR